MSRDQPPDPDWSLARIADALESIADSLAAALAAKPTEGAPTG